MKKKLLSLGLALVSVVTVLAGCGTDKTDYKAAYTDLCYKYQRELAVVNGSGVTCQPTGTGYFQMKTDESKLVFPGEFGFPNSQSGVAGYTVTFNDGTCTLTPPGGWEITAVSSVLYVYNKEQMVQGQFVPGRIDTSSGSDIADTETLRNFMKGYFMTADANYTFTDIYLGDSSRMGVHGHCVVNTSDGTVVINCGMITNNQTTMTYVFTYSGAENQAKEDIIKNMIASCSIGGYAIKTL